MFHHHLASSPASCLRLRVSSRHFRNRCFILPSWTTLPLLPMLPSTPRIHIQEQHIELLHKNRTHSLSLEIGNREEQKHLAINEQPIMGARTMVGTGGQIRARVGASACVIKQTRGQFHNVQYQYQYLQHNNQPWGRGRGQDRMRRMREMWGMGKTKGHPMHYLLLTPHHIKSRTYVNNHPCCLLPRGSWGVNA